MRELATTTQHMTATVPAVISALGGNAESSFVDFFAANIRNANTRAAYLRVWARFTGFLDDLGVADLRGVTPKHVATYIEWLGQERSPATVKQHRAALSQCFDFLVVEQVLPANPAKPVRGPKVVRRTGATPHLESGDFLDLLDAIGTEKIADLRDRALICLMAYTWCRISAILNLTRADYFDVGKRWYIRVSEKGGVEGNKLLHHKAIEALDAYIEAADITESTALLFRSLDRKRQLSEQPLHRRNALDMFKRRARAAGINPQMIRTHSMRATGITNFLRNGGTLERAQQIAGHADPRTTQFYDHSQNEISQEDVERMRFER